MRRHHSFFLNGEMNLALSQARGLHTELWSTSFATTFREALTLFQSVMWPGSEPLFGVRVSRVQTAGVNRADAILRGHHRGSEVKHECFYQVSAVCRCLKVTLRWVFRCLSFLWWLNSSLLPADLEWSWFREQTAWLDWPCVMFHQRNWESNYVCFILWNSGWKRGSAFVLLTAVIWAFVTHWLQLVFLLLLSSQVATRRISRAPSSDLSSPAAGSSLISWLDVRS